MEYNEATLDDNPFRYCGEYYDKETKTIYLRARYYNPAQGRFTQEDPIRDGYNWYAYCGGNPIMFVDPTGKSMKDFIAGLVFSLDDGMFAGLAQSLAETLADDYLDYTPEDEVDYYTGRVLGDLLSMATGIADIYMGLQMINQALTNGVSVVVASNGTLVVQGAAIMVAGTAAGAVTVAYGTTKIIAASSNLGSDLDALITAYEAKSKVSSTNFDQYSASLPTDKTRLNHIFRDKKGHVLDTPENRTLLSDTAISDNYMGTDSFGNIWHAKILDDGRQVWVESRNGIIWDGGINDIPQPWDPIVGLKNKR